MKWQTFRRRARPLPEPPLKVDVVESYEQAEAYWTRTAQRRKQRYLSELALVVDRKSFGLEGFCYVCGRQTQFHVDFLYAPPAVEGRRLPNWRERLVCQGCKLGNRLRASIQILQQQCGAQPADPLYITEQVTPLYRWLKEHYQDVTGSEYLADTIPLGETNRRGIRNESLTRLSFADESFEIILSFDVFEHIPDYPKAFAECLRCLRPGGRLLFSVPFAPGSRENIIRARLHSDGHIEHLLPPEYHGDPVSDAGCLCFRYFGWEMLEDLRRTGFGRVQALVYWSRELGYLGGDQLLFCAVR